MDHRPSLDRHTVGGVTVHTDSALRDRFGIAVAFSERSGGFSSEPYASLNLAYHVGDDAHAVDQNRSALWSALSLGDGAPNFTSAEQVHGFSVARVSDNTQPNAVAPGAVSPQTDALITNQPHAPLLLCFADCVPVVLVAMGEQPAVAVVHAGWRGVVGGVVDQTITALIDTYSIDPNSVLAYIGPHIGPEEFVVSEDVMAVFENSFGRLSLVSPGPTGFKINLEAAVRESLTKLGVQSCNIASMGACTVRSTERFFSYRAENSVTGRHGAVAAILQA